MLNLLSIENIAVIERAEIVFDRGLNVLTGETGAGKSIVIDAISAILGERTYRDLIRTGCDKASVTAVFAGIPHFDWFDEKQIPYDSDELLIHREIHADGKNICRVNARPVTVSVLRELGRRLINIHGQNDTQTLFDEGTHLSYLDLFCEDRSVFDAYLSHYDSYLQKRQLVQKLTISEGERLRRIETLEYQLNEIRKAELEPGEDQELEARKRVLLNAEKLSDSLSEALNALYGSDSSDGALDLLSRTSKELGRVSSFSEKYAGFAETLQELQYSIQDISDDLRNELDDLSYSGDELDRIESRLSVIGRLKKKYGATVEEVLQFAEAAETEMNEIRDSDAMLETLQYELSVVEKAAKDCALRLRENRRKAAMTLQSRIESELSQLDMPNVCFRAEFEETELSPNGMDFVRFLMSANTGEALKPLSKVASGGELARIMLAMKNVLAEKDSVQTLIFDEVDAGVSGRAAQKVAQKLLRVSEGKQVFCVTHLPQIAAAADTHLLIAKAVRQGRTYTSVTRLDRPGRVEELSRIIGGSQITENTRKSAEEMIRVSGTGA